MNIGEIISAFDVLQQQVTSPVQQLRKEIDLMRSELSWYEKKYPESDTTKRRERLMRLEVICKSLESCEPISLMHDDINSPQIVPVCGCLYRLVLQIYYMQNRLL